jgi:hypothetical protein
MMERVRSTAIVSENLEPLLMGKEAGKTAGEAALYPHLTSSARKV